MTTPENTELPDPQTPDESGGGRLVGRAAFLGIVGTGVAGIFAAGPFTRWLQGAAPALSNLVPSSGWRIYTVADRMPDLDPTTFRLDVGGMVDRPVSLSLDNLREVGDRNQTSDFHCVTGWSVYDVRWRGVLMSDLLDHVGSHDAAHAVRFVSAEKPYEDSLTVEQARLGDVMLAYEMDGKPLPRKHGGPLRLVMPKMYGYKSVKWVQRIVLEEKPQPGYWEENGYDADAWVGRSNGA